MGRTSSWAAAPRGRRNSVWLIGAALCTATALVLAALNLASTRADAKSAVSVQPAMVLPTVAVPVDLQRFALNALLVPLLDDAQPPRWTDVAVAYHCGPATRITVDGRPMRPNTPIPATSFSVRWTIDRCSPMGFEALELSGEVELRVFHEENGLGAIVMPQRLAVTTLTGRSYLPGPFAAHMALDVAAAAPGQVARHGQ